MKMSTCYWVHVLLTIFILLLAYYFIIVYCLLKFTQVRQHMNSDKIRHLCVHLLPVKKLESKIFSTTTTWCTWWLVYHIIKIYFTFTDSCGYAVLHGWFVVTFALIAFNLYWLHIKLHPENFLTGRSIILLIELHLLLQYTGYFRVFQ